MATLDLPTFITRWQAATLTKRSGACEALGVQAGDVTEFAAALREQAEPGEAEVAT